MKQIIVTIAVDVDLDVYSALRNPQCDFRTGLLSAALAQNLYSVISVSEALMADEPLPQITIKEI